MAGIRIDEIKYKNFRQYGTGAIKFSLEKDYMLSIMVAQNGTGKTTFLNSITWCLYGKEYHLTDETKALPVVNTKVLTDKKDGEKIDVSVALTILDDDKIVDFERKQSFIVRENAEGVKNGIAGVSELNATVTVRSDFTNSKVLTGADADLLVKQYFHDDIYDFYFFDGEKLKEFFAEGRQGDIKRSIYNISQVSLLENVCDHVKKLLDKQTRALGKESPDIEKLYEKKEREEENKNLNERLLLDSKSQIDSLKKENEQIDLLLRKHGPIKELQEERERLEEDLQRVEADKEEFHVERSSFIRRYVVLLNLYPRMQKILAYIEEKESDGELPPSIDIDQVKRLLDNLDQPCPLCDHEIGESGRQHLERLLTKISVSSKTSNFLKEIKGPLENACEEAVRYEEKRKDFSQREVDIEEREKKISDRLQEINRTLINYESNDEKVNVSKLENDRSTNEEKIATANQTIGVANANIKMCDEELKRIAADIKVAEDKIEKCEDAKKQLAVLSMMQKNFKSILANITGGMRIEIENTTRSIFSQMNWKNNTFGDMKIDDDYAVSVYDKGGLVMTGSLSATEQMALAYAFILAIHQASGRNCPLVIDSPIGRSSDINREHIAKALRETSKEKQIIMLFTPDDYTEPVQELYGHVANVRNLSLSEDEKFVEGIDR